MSQIPHIYSVKSAEFQEKVVDASAGRPVLVDFWAEWCGPCKALAPVLEQLAEKYCGKLSIAKVNTDEEQTLAMEEGIRSLPTLRLYHHGDCVSEIVGAQPLSVLEAAVSPFLARESDALRRQALDAVEAGDLETAVKVLSQALESDPDNYRIHPELAAAFIDTGNLDWAEQVLKDLPANEQLQHPVEIQWARLRFARIGKDSPQAAELEAALQVDPDDLAARYYRSARKALSGCYDEALSGMLNVVQRDRHYGDDAARKTMLDIFTILGSEDPLVKEYRTRLARVLN